MIQPPCTVMFNHEFSTSWFCSVLIELYIEGHAVRIMDYISAIIMANGNYKVHLERKLRGG